MTVAGSHHRRTVHLNGCPVWSPDGKTLAVADAYGPTLVGGTGRVLRRLHVMKRRALSLGQVAWSADGRQLAYLSGSHLFVVGADGRGARRLL